MRSGTGVQNGPDPVLVYDDPRSGKIAVGSGLFVRVDEADYPSRWRIGNSCSMATV